MANVIMTFSKHQDKQILCQMGYNQPIIHGGYTIRLTTYSVHNLSNVPLFINELGARGIFSYQVGREVIINGNNIR